MKFAKDKKLICLVIAVLITLLSALLSEFSVFSSLQNTFTNRLFSPTSVRDDIVILALDNKSVNANNEGINLTGREEMTEIFNNLAKLNPKVVAVDRFFIGENRVMQIEDDYDMTKLYCL